MYRLFRPRGAPGPAARPLHPEGRRGLAAESEYPLALALRAAVAGAGVEEGVLLARQATEEIRS